MLQLYRSLAIFQKDKSGSVIHNLVFKINIGEYQWFTIQANGFQGKKVWVIAQGFLVFASFFFIQLEISNILSTSIFKNVAFLLTFLFCKFFFWLCFPCVLVIFPCVFPAGKFLGPFPLFSLCCGHPEYISMFLLDLYMLQANYTSYYYSFTCNV